AAQAHVSLHLDRGADRVVLGGAQLVGIDPAGGVVRARRQAPRRAEQTADVISPERGRCANGHDSPQGCPAVLYTYTNRRLGTGLVEAAVAGDRWGGGGGGGGRV